MALLILKENHCAKFFMKSMHKCKSYGQHKLNSWPFYHLTFKCDLDLKPSWKNVSNGISTHQGEQLCQIILKSMHRCESYGPENFNSWPVYHLTFKCILDLQRTWKNGLTGTFTPRGEQLAKLFWNSCINVEVMAQPNPKQCTSNTQLTHNTGTYTKLKL